MLIQHKPSTQANLRSHLRKYITPFFALRVRDVRPDTVQLFISNIKANPKTVRNIYVTLQMMWKSARAWQYVAHDALDGVVLPKRRKPRTFSFTQEEVTRILGAAKEPYRTFYLARSGDRASCRRVVWIAPRRSESRDSPGAGDTECVAREAPGTENGERHSHVCHLAEPGRTPQAVHRHMATESPEATVCVEKRNAVGSELVTQAKVQTNAAGARDSSAVRRWFPRIPSISLHRLWTGSTCH